MNTINLNNINDILNNPEKFNINTQLTQDEKDYLIKFFYNNNVILLDIQKIVDEILSDNKIDYHDIPNIILLLTKMSMNYFKINTSLNIFKFIKFITEVIIFLYVKPSSVDQIITINKLIDVSINILKINPHILTGKYNNFLTKINSMINSCCKRNTNKSLDKLVQNELSIKDELLNKDKDQEKEPVKDETIYKDQNKEPLKDEIIDKDQKKEPLKDEIIDKDQEKKEPLKDEIIDKDQNKEPLKDTIIYKDQDKELLKDEIIDKDQKKEPIKDVIIYKDQEKEPVKDEIIDKDQKKEPIKDAIIYKDQEKESVKDKIIYKNQDKELIKDESIDESIKNYLSNKSLDKSSDTSFDKLSDTFNDSSKELNKESLNKLSYEILDESINKASVNHVVNTSPNLISKNILNNFEDQYKISIKLSIDNNNLIDFKIKHIQSTNELVLESDNMNISIQSYNESNININIIDCD